jgi:uncharacterized RDD family membrane protein YckC
MQDSLNSEDLTALLSTLDEDIPPIEPIVNGKQFSIRAVAFFIDYAIIWLVLRLINTGIFLLIHFLVTLYAENTGVGFQIQPQDQILSRILSVVLILIYMVFFTWLVGTTPGKLILKMRVVTDQGERAGFIAALKRSVALFFDTLFLALPAYLKMEPPLYQRYGDQFANTIVVDIKDPVIKPTYKKRWFFLSSAVFVVFSVFAAIILGASTISPFTPLVRTPAAQINLQLSDFPQKITLRKESTTIPSTNKTITDANTRSFIANDHLIVSEVLIFNHFPRETNASLKLLIENNLKKLYPDPQLTIVPEVEYSSTSPILIERFTDASQNVAGYSSFIVKKNVAIRTDVFGKPGSISLDDIQQLKTIMLSRIP